MSTLILLPTPTTSTGNVDGLPIEDYINYNPVNDTDLGNCLRVEGDAKVARQTDADPQPTQFYFEFQDTGALPVGAVISAVKVVMRHRFVGVGVAHVDPVMDVGKPIMMVGPLFAQTLIAIALPTTSSFQTDESVNMATNPVTSAPWVRGDLFRVTPDSDHMWACYTIILDGTGLGDSSYEIDYFALVVTYTATPMQWCFNPTSNHYVFAETCPGAPFVSSDPPVPAITGFRPRST